MPPRALLFFMLSAAAAACSEDGPKGTVPCEESRPVSTAGHVFGTIDYPDPPPTGGDHNPCWATWGVHTDVVPTEQWVHNLEHGGVVFLYQAGEGGSLRPDEEAALTALVGRLPRTLLTAYPGPLNGRFAVIAWGHRLVSECLDVDADERFYAEHFDHAPEHIPDNPTCN
jgi:Protein of unknown function (DUF3105)